MPISTNDTGFYRLSLAGPCAAAELALPTLQKHLGLGPDEAMWRLTHRPSVLCECLAAPKARLLSRVLAALGVQLRLDVAGAAPTTEPAPTVDISVQPLEARFIDEAAQALTKLLSAQHLSNACGTPGGTSAALAGPGGLILKDVPEAAARRLRGRMHAIKGLVTSVSAPLSALYDLLPGHRVGLSLPVAFLTDIRRLGLEHCRLTGAVAARMNHQTCALLLARYPRVPLIALNHDFQLFDLFLTPADIRPRRDLADFLLGRSDLPRDSLGPMPGTLKIESGLSRANALAFQADYAALGLETCARLRVWHPHPLASRSRADHNLDAQPGRP